MPDGTQSIARLGGPKGLPILGNALQLDSARIHSVLEAWARKHGPVFRVGFGPRQVLVLAEPTLIQAALADRPDTFRRVVPVEAVLHELGVNGVFSAEGASWKRQRKLIMPAFSMRQQRNLFAHVASTTERLREHWQRAAEAGAAVDARSDLMRYTVDVTSQVVFGRDLGTLAGKHSELQDHMSRIFHTINVRVNALLPYWRWLKLPRDHAVDVSVQHVRALIESIIVEARRELERDPARAEQPKTLLEAMIVSQDEEDASQRFSNDEIVGNVMTLLLAGEDTTSNTLSWMLHYMAHEPEVQRRLREEADALLGEARVAPRYEDVAKLVYAAAVTQETLRMRSAAPVLFMEPTRDTQLGDIAVPAGHWVFCLTRYCATSEASFRDAQRFAPERWLGDAADGGAHDTRAQLAFGGGPRTCPGRSLALFECAMAASMIARNFVVEPISGRDQVEEVFDFTMFPRGLRVRFVPRS
jgi:cytochrome P450